jgi:hypothetical protein
MKDEISLAIVTGSSGVIGATLFQKEQPINKRKIRIAQWYKTRKSKWQSQYKR